MKASAANSATAFRAVFIAASMAVSVVATHAFGRAEVVPIPQSSGSTLYLRGTLNANGTIAALAPNSRTARLIRWTDAGGPLVECASPGSFSVSYAIKVTDIGTTTGGWYQPASPFFRGGALWNASGVLSIGPFGGSGAYGEAVAGSTNGYPYFISDLQQGLMYQLGSSGAPVSRGRPAGTISVYPRDASRDGTACVLAASTTTATHAYRWTLAGGYQQVPLIEGSTATAPIAISDDGLRIVGLSTTPSGQQGFVWSVESGLTSMGIPAGASIGNLAASGDCMLVCGQYTVGSSATPFVWSAAAGLVTASAFAASRCLVPGGPIEFLDFNADGAVALARIGSQTVLIRNLRCVAGDFDHDGHVDAADLAALLANWGQPGPTDLDGDGTTAATDLATALTNWS